MASQDIVYAPTPTVQAGDEVQFRVRISHTAESNAPAFGLVLTDKIAEYFNLVTGSTNTTLGYVNNSKFSLVYQNIKYSC